MNANFKVLKVTDITNDWNHNMKFLHADNDGGDVAGKYNEKNAPEVKDSVEQRQMRGSI